MNVHQRQQRMHRGEVFLIGLVLACLIGAIGPVGPCAWGQESDGLERAPRASSALSLSRLLGAGNDANDSTTTTDTVVGPIMALDSGPVPTREMDEADSPLNLLPEKVASIIYGRRNFQYDAKGRSDPMIVPWIRIEVLSQEHLTQARTYLREADDLSSPAAKQKRYLAALAECEEVLRINEDSKYGKDALALKAKVQDLLDELSRPVVGPDSNLKPRRLTPKPPQWVVINTKAVIYDQTGRGGHIVLVGDNMLSVGDKVPKYESVKVVEIKETSVTYEFTYDPNQESVPFEVSVTEEAESK